MYIDVKETMKKYYLVKMKEARGDASSLKESWLLQMATCGPC